MKNDKQTLDEYTQWSRKDKTAFCRSNIDALNNYIDDQNLSEVQISYIQNFCADLPKLALRNYERFKRFDNLILDGTLLNIYINHYIRNPSDCTGVPVQYKDYLPSFPQIIEWLNESTILKNKNVSDFASSQIRRLEWTDSFGLNVRKYSVLRKIILDANNTPAYNFVIDVVLLKGIRGCVGKQLLEEDFRECIPELSIKKNQKLFANSLIRNIVIEKANLHAINQSYDLIFEIALTLEYLGFKLKSPATIVFDKIYEYVKSEFHTIVHEVQLSDIKKRLISQTGAHKKITLNDIDLMTGKEFETFISQLFQKMGYRTEITKYTGDQGIDILAFRNDLAIGIQTKCFSSTVGNSSIQEVVAGSKYYKVKTMMVITNNYFTKAAITLAQANDVILWDREMLRIKINENQ